MCGIAGVFSIDGRPADSAAARRMAEAMLHRGPDDGGEFADGPLAFAFRRLSILDLEGGHQPMSTADGRFTIVFNGEIYNHPQLKAGLESDGVRYSTRSDTETILLSFRKDGLVALRRLRGMFAFGVWDKAHKRLTLARDPIGIKPLYWAEHDGKLYFASELRALVAAGVPTELDPLGVWDYLSWGYARGPRTVLAAVRKLVPGGWLEADEKGVRLGDYYELPAPDPKPMRADECQERLDHLLTRAVKSHLLSDVPVGAFLSGGLDSSLITALMAEHGPVQTFSIGFEGARAGLDESKHAKRVAEALGCRHHELVLPANVLDRLEDAIAALDEPLADSAVLPTYLLSKHAKKSVKVVLSGEGADELFGGYPRYKAAYLQDMVAQLPAIWHGRVYRLARRFGPGSHFKRLPIEGARAWSEACRLTSREMLYSYLSPGFVGAVEKDVEPEWLKPIENLRGFAGALAHDLRTTMVDALLMKTDKASMRASLEARVPFLDLDLAQYALHIPSGLKVRQFKSKWILRRLAAKKLPSWVASRKKHGFHVPWEEWVRSPNPAVDQAVKGLAETGLFELDLIGKAFMEVRELTPHTDAGLMYRVAVLALWFQSLGKKTPR
jgi:asparagine synthase (glutamine-hydrolysing)